MALSNAERQARHRERVKAKLAASAEPAPPLRNDGQCLLEDLQFAFLAAERQATVDALDRIDRPLPDDSGWHSAAEALQESQTSLESLTKEFFINLIDSSAARSAERLVMEIRREHLVQEIRKRDTKTPEQANTTRRKRVT